jgi:hypothetical protein
MIPPGLVPLAFDGADLQLMGYGLRRANTPRLRGLLERTRQQAEVLIRRRMSSGRPIERMCVGWTWRRSAGTWRVREAFDVEADGAPSVEYFRRYARSPRRLAASTVDFAKMLGGPLEMLLGRTIKLSAVDFERRVFSFDHVALVHADGSLGDLLPTLPGYVPTEARS